MGGPFVPAGREGCDGLRAPGSIAKSGASRDRPLHAHARHPPVRKPLDGIDLMSGFGVRMDPFTGSPAMHTGLDLHGETGDPVRATADGTVTTADGAAAMAAWSISTTATA